MKIVLLESLSVSKECMKKYTDILEQEGHSFQCYERNDDPEVQIQEIGDADIVMIANMPLSGKVISACPNLKFIDVAFTGVDHVDLQAAKEKGIAVSNASGYSNESVAELVLGMMLSLLRNVPQVEERCRKGMTKDGLVGRELKGKTVGVVGTGAIGSRVAELCHLFGCEIAAYDLFPKKNAPEYLHYGTLEEVLSKSDIVTLHCPLTEDSRNLINQDRIAQMNQYQPTPQPLSIPAPANNQGILWVQGETGAKSYLVAPGSSVLLMDSESERFYIKSTDVSGMPQPLRIFEYHEINGKMPQKRQENVMADMYVTREEYQDLFNKYNEILNRLNSFSANVEPGGTSAKTENRRVKGGTANE